ncbi:hypothetical protein L9F63_013195, partial [Diploptera punctata]
MSLFDSLVNKVWELARQDVDFLADFSRLTNDKARVEKILSLQEIRALKVLDNFNSKYEIRAEELRSQGNINTAVKYAPASSAVLGLIYIDRCQSLLQSNNTDLALDDARRALEHPISQQDAIRVQSFTAACHHQMGNHKLAENCLNDALNKLKISDLPNELKASMTGEIVEQLRKIKQKRRQQKPKISGNRKTSTFNSKVEVPRAALPRLTYGKNASIGAASAALRLCESEEKGRYMTATRDIKLGSVLIVEQPYAWSLTGESLSDHCLHCCDHVDAPIPCNHCATVRSFKRFRRSPPTGIKIHTMNLDMRNIHFLNTRTIRYQQTKSNSN